MELPADQRIVALNDRHLEGIEALLEKCGLPFEDCNEQLENFFGIIDNNKLAVTGAVQIQGPYALLRSIAVLPEKRGLGLAAAMTQYLLALARSKQVHEIYLLTETAENYFSRFGFFAVDRKSLPGYIRSTRQFDSLCPSDARAMRLDL